MAAICYRCAFASCSITSRLVHEVAFAAASSKANQPYSTCSAGWIVNAVSAGNSRVKTYSVFSVTPGATKWLGPALGEHNHEVLRALGLDDAHIEMLKNEGVL